MNFIGEYKCIEIPQRERESAREKERKNNQKFSWKVTNLERITAQGWSFPPPTQQNVRHFSSDNDGRSLFIFWLSSLHTSVQTWLTHAPDNQCIVLSTNKNAAEKKSENLLYLHSFLLFFICQKTKNLLFLSSPTSKTTNVRKRTASRRHFLLVHCCQLISFGFNSHPI